jgi:hypothetical protein
MYYVNAGIGGLPAMEIMRIGNVRHQIKDHRIEAERQQLLSLLASCDRALDALKKGVTLLSESHRLSVETERLLRVGTSPKDI